MAGDELRVAPAELTRAAESAGEAYEAVSKRLESLQSRLADLRSSWTGSAATSFLDLWNELESESRDMLADVKHIGDSLQATADTYDRQEQGTENAVRSTSLNLRV